MSDQGADQDEMRRFSTISDPEIDELLTGDGASPDVAPAQLVEFLDVARSGLSATPDELTEARHLAAIVEAAQLAAPGIPASPAAPRASERAEWVAFSWRRRIVFNKKVSSLAAVVGLAGGIAIVGFSGSAYAGVLPDPIQGAVADVGDRFGLSLPGADETDTEDREQNQVDDADRSDVDDDQQVDVDDGASNDVDDGQQGNVDDGDQVDVDDGATHDVDDGQQGDVDDDQQVDVDDGATSEVDDGDQVDLDDDAQDDADDGEQDDADDSSGHDDDADQGDAENS